MLLARETVAGWAVIASLVGAVSTGCASASNSSSPSSSAASSSSAAASPQPTGYRALLIKASDIGGDLTASQPAVLNPNGGPGVAQLFANPDNSRRVEDTIAILADPAAAAAALDNTKTTYVGKVSGVWKPADVGSNGALISGTSPDNSQAITVLLFTQGRALVSLEFDSAPNDPIDADVATDIGRKQDTAIRKGLPG
jgi:hypothetical protein